MENALCFYVYSKLGLVAVVSNVRVACCLVCLLGLGAKICPRLHPNVSLWREGCESQSAAESYDFVEATVIKRLEHLKAVFPEVRACA